MGLSDPERINGLYHSLYRLTSLRGQLLEEKQRNDGQYPGFSSENPFKEIENLLSGIWHDFLGQQSNSIHWLFGSSSTKKITQDDMSPWAVAVRVGSPCSLIYDWEPGKALEWSENHSDDDLESFNPFKASLLIPAFLKKHDDYRGPFNSLIYDVYSELETTVYYLRRYQDAFLSKYDTLNKTVSLLVGLCFCHMCSTDAYSRAYVLLEICKILYGQTFFFKHQKDKLDPVTKWALDENVHHYIPRVLNDWKIEQLADLHVALLGLKDDNRRLERLLGFLKVVGREYYYDHQHVRVLKMCEENNLNTEEALTSVKMALALCKEEHEAYEKDKVKNRDVDTKLDDVSVYS